MAETQKYYWLKLKRDFFKRHDIRIIEEMPNGKDYILFYLKLLLESIDHEGALRFSDTIPYNEHMLSIITNTNIDIVKSAMDIFISLDMMYRCDDQTLYMKEVEKLIGSETKWAEKKRLQRAKEDNVLDVSSNCPIEKENRNKDKEYSSSSMACASMGENEISPQTVLGGELGGGVVMMSDEQFNDLCDKLSYEEIKRYIAVVRDCEMKGHKYAKSHYQAILDMAKEDRRIGNA